MPYPNQVIDTLKAHPNAFIVRGNEEDRIEKLSGSDRSRWTDGQFQALYWYYDEITPENRNYLIKLPRQITIDQCLHIAHRSSDFIGDVEMNEFSTHHLKILFKDHIPNKAQINTVISEKLNQSDDFQQRLCELPDGIYAFGHSHIQWHKRFGNKILVNPGSCGSPIDYAGDAPYTLVDITNGNIFIEERRVKYDEQKCVDDLLNSSLYKHEKVWNEIIICEFKAHSEMLMPFLAFTEAYANRINDPVRPYSKQTWNDAYTEWLKTLSSQ